jgi:hypothetical protein
VTLLLLRTAAGAILISFPGLSALRPASWARSMTRSGRMALALAVGLAVAVPAALAAALLGLPLQGKVIAGICLLLALAIRLLSNAPIGRSAGIRFPRSKLTIVSRFLLAAAAALFLAKLTFVPVWSWDYYAVHGTRARRIFAEKPLDLTTLRFPGLALSHPDYPLGLPISWRLLALGEIPTSASVKLAHAVFALALLALVREGLFASGCREPVANTGAAFAAISPLLWDTESLGLAELSFALFLAGAFVVFLRFPKGFSQAQAWIFGTTAGFLPWLKLREGLTLATFLSIALFFSGRSRRPAIVVIILWAASSAYFSILFLPPGERFLAGDWVSRGLSRFEHPCAIATALAKGLLAPEWFGFWIVFAAGWIFAVVGKRPTAALLTSVIAAQVAAYGSVYFFTYLDPAAHIGSSFFRIVAALLPAGLVALAASARESDPAQNTLRMSL